MSVSRPARSRPSQRDVPAGPGQNPSGAAPGGPVHDGRTPSGRDAGAPAPPPEVRSGPVPVPLVVARVIMAAQGLLCCLAGAGLLVAAVVAGLEASTVPLEDDYLGPGPMAVGAGVAIVAAVGSLVCLGVAVPALLLAARLRRRCFRAWIWSVVFEGVLGGVALAALVFLGAGAGVFAAGVAAVGCWTAFALLCAPSARRHLAGARAPGEG
ncbi:hypothetical protein SAMN02745673_02533 [Marinactinospora thermotolerans DSM 45154]|uniref:Uncharacterized protein n=2 Tax=Marinactinospora thermotolerans TaxID=531310 RepID=A0A1T4R5U3_9ACTN|nr:hypothetical protein SAMN02745673_02533 [Marinactinospora thermotolerans DSM 45154]